jgi:ligand-binding sensor domain-containing protein
MTSRLSPFFFVVVFFASISFAQQQSGDVHYFVNTNDVRRIVRDGDNLWIASFGGGLIKYNTVTGSKTHFLRTNSGIPSHLLRDITIAKDGKIWIATNNKGIVSFDGVNWRSYTVASDGLLSNAITAITIDTDGNVWAGTADGLQKYDGSTWQSFVAPALPANHITSLAVDSNNTLWIGLYKNDNATIAHRASGTITFDNAQGTTNMPRTTISTIEVDNSGTIWFGADNMNLYTKGKDTWTKIEISKGKPSNILYSISGVVGLASSSDNGMWVTTPYALFRFDKNGNEIDFISHEMNANYPNPREGMVEAGAHVWFGSNEGLCSYEKTVFNKYAISNSALNENTIGQMKCSPNGTVWFMANGFSSYHNGLWNNINVTYDPSNIPEYGEDGTNANGFILKGDSLDCILLGYNGFIKYGSPYSSLFYDMDNIKVRGTYIGLNNGDTTYMVKQSSFLWRLCTFDGKTINDYTEDDELSPIVNTEDMIFDKNGSLWFAQTFFGAVKYNSQVGWTKYNPNLEPLPFSSIYDFELDSTGTLWGAADSGLVRYNSSSDSWDVFHIPASINEPVSVRAIAVESDTSIYAFTGNNELLLFNGTDWKKFTKFDYAWPEFGVKDIALDKLGNLWISSASSEGALVYRKGGPVLDVKRQYQTGSTRSLTIFPSPAEDHISIELPEGVHAKSLSIIDILGRTVYSSDGMVTKTVQISHLPTGYYKVICISDNGTVSGSFTK